MLLYYLIEVEFTQFIIFLKALKVFVLNFNKFKFQVLPLNL